jgi:hypothetical protein
LPFLKAASPLVIGAQAVDRREQLGDQGMFYCPIPCGVRVLDLGIHFGQHILLPGTFYIRYPPL